MTTVQEDKTITEVNSEIQDYVSKHGIGLDNVLLRLLAELDHAVQSSQ